MDIQKILYEHKKWLAGEPGGVRADLNDANLSYVDLHGVDLSGADLRRANLRGVTA